MEKRILVVYYSQTGQLAQIADDFLVPFKNKGIVIEIVRIKPVNDFPFPWNSALFFDVMPESVLEVPIELEQISFNYPKYDLVILAYQPWFLSPSIPITSLFENHDFKAILTHSPVVTLIGARNMWLNAQEKIKARLRSMGSQLVGNIVLTDRHQNHLSAVSILHWMLSGKKDRYLSIFPKPGVSVADIESSKHFGAIVVTHLESSDWNKLQNALVKAKALEIKADLMFIEQRAGRLFYIWANLAKNKKNRAAWLVAYKYYLLFALFIVAPLVLIINNIFFRPFFKKAINRKKQYYLGVN